MEVGDKITFPFGKEEKEGTVYKIFPKTVYLKVDFPNHSGKIVKRSVAQLEIKAQKKKPPKKRRSKQTPKDKSTA